MPAKSLEIDRSWSTRREDKAQRLCRAANLTNGRVLRTDRIVDALEVLLAPGDRVALEGNNQKQADFLSRSLAKVDPAKVHGLHMLISSISRPEQIDIFETGIARRIDFAFAGPQSLRVAQLVEDGSLEVGAKLARGEINGWGEAEVPGGEGAGAGERTSLVGPKA